MYRILWLITLATLVAACGEADSDSAESRLLRLDPAEALDISTIDRGVGIHSGEAMAIASYQPTVFPKLVTALPHAVITVNAYDAAAQELGEYITFPAPQGVDSRGPVVFKSTSVASGRFAARVDDAFEEIAAFGSQAGADDFTSSTIVIDFWRLRRDWHVRWDGKLEDLANTVGRGQYGFFRTDFSEELLDQIETAAETHKPRYFIVGVEMERFLATSEGAGLAPHEFANFFAFYQEAVARVKSVSPSTKVGFGIDWDRYYNRVSLSYAPDDTDRDEAVKLALQTTLVPLWKASDVIALSLYQSPGAPSDHYQFLRLLPELYDINLPIMYHSVGSGVTSTVNYLDQKNFMDEFGERNAGLNVEFMAWRRVLNFEGTDTNNQVIAGRCLALTQESRGLEMPLTNCYDGLFTSVFSEKEVFSLFQDLP